MIRRHSYSRIRKGAPYKVITFVNGKKTTRIQRDPLRTSKKTYTGVANLPSVVIDPDISNTNDNFTSETHFEAQGARPATYSQTKKKRLESWEKIRNHIYEAEVKSWYPVTFECAFCGSHTENIIKCKDCGPSAYYCGTCCERIHKVVQFHLCQKWQDSTFVPYLPVSEVELLRPDGHSCGQGYLKNLTVIDRKGVQHSVKMQFCSCEPEAVTVRRYNFWPGSPTNPKVAFDVVLLEWMRLLLLKCQVSARSFVEVLRCLCGGASFVDEEKDVYHILVRESAAEYRHHVYQLEHMKGIVENMDDGTTCPACPMKKQERSREDTILDDENISQEDPDPVIISIDANFQLVRKHSSGNSHGAPKQSSFFLDQDEVDNFVKEYGQSKESSDCNEFQAGNNLRSKTKNKKLDETAVFGSVCRHVFPKHFFSLKHGERLSYSVFLLGKLSEEYDKVVLLYDIACRLDTHLKKNNRDSMLQNTVLGIPIFHAFAHKKACQVKYSPRWLDGIGRTDGEGIERLWSYLGKFKKITKEMSPENRVTLLSEALLAYGQECIEKMGTSMPKKLERAQIAEEECQRKMDEALAQVPDVCLDTVENWISQERQGVEPGGTTEKEILSKEEEYAMLLEKLYQERTQDSDNMDSPELIAIRAQVERFEKKNKFRLRWQEESREYCDNVASGRQKKKKNVLKSLQKLARERAFLLALMKKYADGQAIAIRLSGQISKVVNNMKKTMQDYNNLVSMDKDQLTFDMVKSVESPIYDCLGQGPEMGGHRAILIEATLAWKRAKEETSLLQQEIRRIFAYHKNEYAKLARYIGYCSSLASTDYEKGCISFCIRKAVQMECKIQGLQNMFSPYIDMEELPMTYLQQYGAVSVFTGVDLGLDFENEEDDIVTSDQSDLDISEDESEASDI